MTLIKKIIPILMTAALFIAAFSTFCYADSFAGVSIGGKLTIEGSIDQKDDQCFSLASIYDAPMPEGAADGIIKKYVKYGEAFSFGNINYERPGIYQYLVSREIIQKDNLLPDESIYKVTVEIFTDGTDAVIYQKEGGDGKPEEINYIDRYCDPGPLGNTDSGNNSPVKTGDFLPLNKYILLFASALVILLLCRFLLQRKRVD